MILAATKLQHEQELRKVEVEIAESMMEQFARELHDNIGHTLGCMRITIENKKLDAPALEEVFSPVERYLDSAAQQLRLLSRSLNTEYVTKIGLAAAIELEVERLKQLRRINVHWQKAGYIPGINRNEQLMVFRIFQEIVHNTLRHAQAKNIHIFLGEDNSFKLEVRDDGKGFDLPAILQSSASSGLSNIIKRAHMVNMECVITSVQGSGSRFILRHNIKSAPNGS